jgi:DNA-binding SARP family transcriptional activator
MTGALLRAGLVRLVAALLLLAIVLGLPVALVQFVGWPLPRTAPTTDTLSGWLTSPLSDTVILNALAVAAWLLWAAFLPAVATEIRAARRGLPTAATSGGTTNPLRIGAAALVTALTLGTVPPGIAGPPAATPGPTSLGPHTVAAQTMAAQSMAAAVSLPARGPATIHVGKARYSYVVERGDTLSGIAAVWLDDADRWPEICRLNWHRHWSAVGGQLTDCDLIYPGWALRLPADATPPPTARPAPAPSAGDPTPTPRGSGSTRQVPPSQTPSPSSLTQPTRAAGTAGPSQVTATAGAAATSPPPRSATPSPTTPETAAPTRSPQAAAHPDGASSTSPSSPRSPAGPAAAPTVSSPEGVTLPGGFVPWTLATSIGAAVALVWLQRRRRHTPGATDDDPTDLPEPVLEVAREVIRNPDLPTDPDLADRAAQVPDQAPLAPGGIGLVGDGAHAAARAALSAVLSTGGPRDPDRQGEVIIDGTTLTTLIGVDAARLGPWPRLHVADDLDHALAMVETRLLHRARLLDEHALTDLDALRENAPSEEPLPPVLLITETPPPGTRMRVKTTLALGADLDVTALLLGEWAHGTTIDVDADGRAHPLHTTSADGVTHQGSDRLAVLDTDTAVAVLSTLREAHTGQRPVISAQTPSPALTPSPAQTPSPAATPSPVPTPRARLRVFGTPRVDDVTTPGQPLRAKAVELAVLLACHPEGVDTRTIGDHLERGVRMRSADVRVHTNVSNLRHVMGRAAGPRKIGYVIKPGGAYRLDPATVEVDLWQLRDLTVRAATAPPAERIRLLRRACDLYTAPLADGCDYDWVEPHREKARQQATDAHLLLADTLLDEGDPQAASDVLDRAIHHDRYNEALYRKAMHARHTLGDPGGIRALLQALTVALADLDAEPDEDTVQLAQRLRNTTRAKGPSPRNDHQDDGLATTETLLITDLLLTFSGALIGGIIAQVSQRLAAINGTGHGVPSMVGLAGGFLTGAALTVGAWWVTGIIVRRQDRRFSGPTGTGAQRSSSFRGPSSRR